MTKLYATILLAVTILTSRNAWTNNADNAVILLYHHVSSTTPASTSVTPSVFEQHLQHLADGYNVISLEQAVTALKAGQLLPERAAGIYGNLRTLKTKINSLAMPVTSSSVSDPVAQPDSAGDFSFTFAGEDVIAQQMGCYYANEALPVSVDGDTVTVTWDKTLPIGRARVNCTAPSWAQPGRYYWYSQSWFVAGQNGKYPD